MIALVKSIVSVIYTLVNVLISILQSVAVLVINIPNYITFLTDSLNVLPSVVIPFILVSIYIYVMYILIGRSTN